MWVRLLILLAMFGVVRAEEPATLSPQEVVQQVGDAVVLIEAKRDGGLSQGTGFIVVDGGVVTCLHVIDGASSIAVVFRDGTRVEDVFVRAFDVERDLAVLVVDLPKGDTEPTTIAFGDTTAIEPGSRILTIGHPLGLEHTVTEGLVSAWREPTEQEASREDRPSGLVLPPSRLLQISATISPGSSGGPVLNDRAEVVGVATSGVLWGSVGLNFAVPVDALSPLLEQNDAMDLGTFGERVDDVRRELARPLYEDGKMAYELEDTREAVRKLERALKLFPRYHEALLLSGRIAIEEGRIDLAEERFKLATEVDEYSADAWFGLGEVHQQRALSSGATADLSRAEAAFETALGMDGRHARAALNLAMIQILRGSLDRAEELLLSAIDNEPYLADAHYALGLVYLRTERADEAVEVFEQALRQDPDHAMSHFSLAVLHMNLEIATLNGVAPHGASAEHWTEFLRLSEGDATLSEEREAALFYIRQHYPNLLD